MTQKDTLKNIRYAYLNGNKDFNPLILLHGTGGDETELLDLASFLAPESPVLSIRGRLLEHGHITRYFERRDDGSFNLDSLKVETNWLVDAINELAAKFGFDPSKAIVIGFSNGANIALNAVLTNSDVKWKTTVGFAAMQINQIDNPINRKDSRVLLTHGTNDSIVSDENFEALITNLKDSQMKVEILVNEDKHGITQEVIQETRNWLLTNQLLK